MLTLSNVVKYYGNFLALDNISFEINRGDIVAFLGPNGSGKTTTMRIITGFFAPSAGDVTFQGYKVTEMPKLVKSQIGYLPENPPIYPELTVTEYLTFVAELKKMPLSTIKNRVDNVIEMTGLKDKKNFLIGSLSKGYRQRVGIAQSIVNNPALLILDEPTVGLDPLQVIEIRSLIRTLSQEEKRTIILSTHILSEASEICKQAIIINKGKIVAYDKIENLRNFSSSFNIEISTKRNNEILKNKILKLQNVLEIQEKENGFIILAKEDIREEIVRLSVETNAGLVEIKLNKTTLEEVFVKLVK
ncbi:MAG: ABC transporter ATP-binding protein [Brevinematales bacterium]|nr:ABC transporter ATP-binding protein [Brevinematales bacterium]